MRYPYEVRNEKEYFDDIEDEKVPKDMLELATHIVETKRGKFQPEKFQDQYEDALKELLRRKQKGEKIEQPKERAPSNVIDLMDALRRSVKSERERRQRQPQRQRPRSPPQKTSRRRPAKGRAAARHRKAS